MEQRQPRRPMRPRRRRRLPRKINWTRLFTHVVFLVMLFSLPGLVQPLVVSSRATAVFQQAAGGFPPGDHKTGPLAATTAPPTPLPSPTTNVVAASPASRSPAPVTVPGRPTRVPRPTATPAPKKPTPTAVPPGAVVTLEDYVAGLDGSYGVAARKISDGQQVLINADHPFRAASLYKLLVMYRVYEQIEQDKLSLASSLTVESDDLAEAEEFDKLSPGDVLTVGDALERMVTLSSNPAAYVLARATGGWDPVVTTASSLGMKSTRWEGNDLVTTPSDMLRFFLLLANRDLISPKASDDMTALLSRQKINDRIPAGLPTGTRVAHKTGELGDVRNDAGIVFAPGGAYAVVLMANGVNPPDAVAAEVEISRMIFDRLGK